MASSSILAKIGLNSAGFKTGLAKCKAAALGFKSSIGGMFSGIGGQILGALGLSAGVAGLGMLARNAIDTGSKISDMATHLRVGTTELQTLMTLARDAGVETTKFEMSLNNLNLKTIEACDGNESYREAFDRLGIELSSFAKLPLDKKMQTLANAYKKSGESLTGLNDVATLLGQKAGPQMLEILDRLATEGMDKLTESAIASGDIMDEATVAALDRAGDEIGRWQNRIIIGFGTFLADIGSSFGRQKWGLIIGQKFAQVGEFIENSVRNIANYVLATFATIGRFLNGQFGEIIAPIRNVLTDCLMYIGDALATFFGYFDSGWERAINKAVRKLDELRKESNKLAERGKGRNFGDIWSEEIGAAETKNKARKRSDLWSASSVDWYDKEIVQAEKLRNIEKRRAEEAEKARKVKYDKADQSVRIDDYKDRKKSYAREKGYKDSSLAKIGGGGLTAARYDVSEKQLNEAKRQSKLLSEIAKNTEKSSTSSEILMK